jgi:hypothetical protein
MVYYINKVCTRILFFYFLQERGTMIRKPYIQHSCSNFRSILVDQIVQRFDRLFFSYLMLQTFFSIQYEKKGVEKIVVIIQCNVTVYCIISFGIFIIRFTFVVVIAVINNSLLFGAVLLLINFRIVELR